MGWLTAPLPVAKAGALGANTCAAGTEGVAVDVFVTLPVLTGDETGRVKEALGVSLAVLGAGGVAVAIVGRTLLVVVATVAVAVLVVVSGMVRGTEAVGVADTPAVVVMGVERVVVVVTGVESAAVAVALVVVAVDEPRVERPLPTLWAAAMERDPI